jgi:glycosyltransferase involved in cell wall biosynthesis
VSTVSPDRPIAYILGSFPQASQTFIAREIRGLKDHGIPLLVFALGRRQPDALEPADRPWYHDVRFAPLPIAPATLSANVHFVLRAPRTYIRTLVSLVRLPHHPRILAFRAVMLMLTAAWIARQIQRAGGCRQVHAHFALAQTETAMAVSGLLGCPFSFTAHARDIYATPSALEEKIRTAAVVVTCTAYNVEHLRRLCPDVPAAHIRLVHHGVEVRGASAVAESQEPKADPGPPTILAAGRLIDKKGFDTLVAACAELKRRDVTFRCRIFGTGPMDGVLRQQVEREGLRDQIELPGWTAPGTLLDEMARAAVFAMPSRVSDSGDRDGIPNVVLEAMAAGLPVVATEVSGIPEAVEDRKTGLLVPQDSPSALADALATILSDATLRSSYGQAARIRISNEFTLDAATRRLAAVFGVPDLR